MSLVGMFPAVGRSRVKKRSLVSQISDTWSVSYNGGGGKGKPILPQEIKDNRQGVRDRTYALLQKSNGWVFKNRLNP